ncbi:hypothetical protein B0T14DRAFT_442956 [Immersiella caudata]|uniref:RRM domain-containing protein n=1 Tax=Immersiella caudata TaxID=314043 RepID=A0AA39XGT4_9PEZI|nr:hypothetical protein B0T14DRAFT_442956 [Immersiella caudata]
MENFPFIHIYSQARPVEYGVVKIKNIPYGVIRPEILAMIGRNAKLPKDIEEPVHIIMEKNTSKTQDAYVEFATLDDATKAVERYQDLVQNRRQPRLEDRPIKMVVSSQEELVKDIFPFAHGISWRGATPVLKKPVEGDCLSTFKGFVTAEEMALLLRFVEAPQRSPFAKNCPQRPFECMISTLKKFPWFCPELVTVMQRHLLYNSTLRLAEMLRKSLDHPKHDPHDPKLNEHLMRRLFQAAMLCPGFSIVQKDNIALACELKRTTSLNMFNIPSYADSWAHQHTLCPKPGIPVDVLEYYIALIREETTLSAHQNLSEEARQQVLDKFKDTDDNGYFGFAWAELDLPDQKNLANWTLKGLGQREMSVFQAIVQRALMRAI